MEDIPGMRSEPFTSNIMNFVSYLHVELRSITFAGGQPRNFALSWADVDKSLREAEGFGDYLSGSRRFRSLMAGLATDGAAEDEKISSVLDWFRKNIRWGMAEVE